MKRTYCRPLVEVHKIETECMLNGETRFRTSSDSEDIKTKEGNIPGDWLTAKQNDYVFFDEDEDDDSENNEW